MSLFRPLLVLLVTTLAACSSDAEGTWHLHYTRGSSCPGFSYQPRDWWVDASQGPNGWVFDSHDTGRRVESGDADGPHFRLKVLESFPDLNGKADMNYTVTYRDGHIQGSAFGTLVRDGQDDCFVDYEVDGAVE